MEIVRIFGEENAEEGLYALRYKSNQRDEFSRLFDLWNDTEYVFNFCVNNQEDIFSAFQRHLSTEEAVEEIMDEAMLLEQQLFDYTAEIRLQELFKPLSNNEYTLYPLQKSKASVAFRKIRRPKLRIYAIRLAPNLFIITGGSIKLTATMNDRPHLLAELKKLDLVKNWLTENELYTSYF